MWMNRETTTTSKWFQKLFAQGSQGFGLMMATMVTLRQTCIYYIYTTVFKKVKTFLSGSFSTLGPSSLLRLQIGYRLIDYRSELIFSSPLCSQIQSSVSFLHHRQNKYIYLFSECQTSMTFSSHFKMYVYSRGY